jgi:hypothetical protein
MDEEHFDRVIRSLTNPTARRSALAGCLSAILASALARFEDESVEAKKRRRRKRQKTCPTGTKTCGKTCIAVAECCGGCPADQQCCNGSCIGSTECCGCRAGQQCCAGTCTDLATDGANCGACGRSCADGGCVNGACTCNGGSSLCPGSGCACGGRLQGNPPACFGGVTNTPCDEDADCPLGTFCLVDSRCSGPCA